MFAIIAPGHRRQTPGAPANHRQARTEVSAAGPRILSLYPFIERLVPIAAPAMTSAISTAEVMAGAASQRRHLGQPVLQEPSLRRVLTQLQRPHVGRHRLIALTGAPQ